MQLLRKVPYDKIKADIVRAQAEDYVAIAREEEAEAEVQVPDAPSNPRLREELKQGEIELTEI